MNIKIRKAKIRDALKIKEMIDDNILEADLLPRTLDEIRDNIYKFIVAECDNIVCGTIAFEFYEHNTAEIRSLVVDKKYRGNGIGDLLMKEFILQARAKDIGKIFAVTNIPSFFEKYSFKRISRDKVPEKFWQDCFKCSKYETCMAIILIYNFN